MAMTPATSGGMRMPRASGKPEIEEHNLNDKRRPADRFDVEDGDAAEEAAPGGIGKPGDHAEQETDEQAASVMMSVSFIPPRSWGAVSRMIEGSKSKAMRHPMD